MSKPDGSVPAPDRDADRVAAVSSEVAAALAAEPDPDTAPPIPKRARRTPLTRLLDLFSSIRLGVVLMVLIFVYSSIGSAGVPTSIHLMAPSTWHSVREIFDISEFDWFHWWPFDLMIALFCLNLTVATIRRIPFNVVNLGVWMIHAGLIILALGSVYYFSTKREGDTPVPRRDVVVRLAGQEDAVRMVASPGNRLRVGEGADAYTLRIGQITPDWELLSGEDAGKRAYKVTVEVRRGAEVFFRELIAGHPQYTEDLILDTTQSPPMQRAKNVLGTPLVDDGIDLALDYSPAEWLYLMESRAIYLRELGSDEWIRRPIRDLPLFNDRIAALDHVWLAGGDTPPLRPIDVRVPADDADDPLPDVTFVLGEYLRYASLQTRRVDGGEFWDPWVDVTLMSGQGDSARVQLLASSPTERTALEGALVFEAIAEESRIETLATARPPAIEVRIPGAGPDGAGIVRRLDVADTLATNPDLAWTVIEGTDYAVRVEAMEGPLQLEQGVTELAVVQIRRGEDEVFTRWVFDLPELNRDLPLGESLGMHSEFLDTDPGIELAYTPGRRQAIRLVAGPEPRRLRAIVPGTGGRGEILDVEPRRPILLAGDLRMVVTSFVPFSRADTRPAVIPVQQRDRGVGMNASMVRVSVPDGAGGTISRWLTYHLYPFDGPEHVIRRFPYNPQVIELADGRVVEMLFSRDRMPLPAPVILEDFVLRTHQGGFDGMVSSIRDWKSVVRFAEDPDLARTVDDGGPLAQSLAWDDTRIVHMNNPSEDRGFWYFQSQWDPPDQPRFQGDPGSRGLNYTVLGVGNRNGVYIQLWGCVISVAGMLYAFYVKPWIKRRRQERVLAGLAAAKQGRAVAGAAAAETPALAGAGRES